MTTLVEQGQAHINDVLGQFGLARESVISASWEINDRYGAWFVDVEWVDSDRVHHASRYSLNPAAISDRWCVEYETLRPL